MTLPAIDAELPEQDLAAIDAQFASILAPFHRKTHARWPDRAGAASRPPGQSSARPDHQPRDRYIGRPCMPEVAAQ